MTQTNQAFGVGLPAVDKVERDPGLGRPSPIISAIRDNFPEFRFHSEYNLTNRLQNDNEFGKKISASIYQAGLESNPDFKKQVEQDPNVGFNAISTILNNMRKEALATSYTGQDIRRTVINRGSEFGKGGQVRPSSDVPLGTVRDQSPLPVTHDFELGTISKMKESGGNPAAISTRKEYGKWQIATTTGTMDTFLSSHYMNDYRDKFKGLKPGTKEFDEKFKSLANDEGFINAQRRFVTDTHFAPVEKIWKKAGIDTSNVAVREAIFSASVQHSERGNGRILEAALANVTDPTDTQAVLRSFYGARKNYVAGLNMDGVTEKQKQNILGRYDAELQEVSKLIGKYDTPIPDPETMRTAISKDPKKYPEIVSDPKNPSIPTGAQGNQLLTNQAKNDPKFREKVTEDSISLFENELLKIHNMPIDPETETDMYSSAYSIYHGYGSEGLTKFINLIQLSKQNEGVAEAAKDKRLSEAERWFKSPSSNGYSPQQYMSTFVGGMLMEPPQQTLEMQYELPKDWNTFTAPAYYMDPTIKMGVARPVDDFAKNIVDFYYESPSMSTIASSRLFPKMRDNAAIKPALMVQIADGIGSHYMDFVQDIAFDLLRGEGPYTVQNLIDTVGANAQYDKASGRYIIPDISQLPVHARLAVDVLRQNPQTEALFMRDGTTDIFGEKGLLFGNRGEGPQAIIFAPDRFTEAAEGKGSDSIAKSFVNMLRPLVRTKERKIYDGIGNLVGSYTEPDNEGINYGINALLNIPLAAANIFSNVIGGLAEATSMATGAMGLEGLSRGLGHMADAYEDNNLYYQANPTGENLTGSILGLGTEMAALYYGASRLGTRFGQLTKNINVLSRYNKAYKIGAGVTPGLAGTNNTYKVLSNLFSQRAGKLYVGFGLTDIIYGKNYSILNTPLLGEDVQRFYRRQDDGMKMALNVLSGLAAGEVFDWGLAGLRTLWTKGVRGKANMGWGEEVLSRTQIGEMVSSVSAGLRNMEIGDYATARAKYLSEGATHLSERNPENLADIAVGFTAGMGSSFRTLKADILDKIKTTNAQRSMALQLRMTDEQMETMADRLYTETIRDAARGVLNMIQSGRGGVEDATWLRFTQLLEEGSGMATVRPVADPHGVLYEYDNVADAVQQMYARADDGSLVPNGKFYRVNEAGKFNLYEVHNDLWALDLASEIRRIATQTIDQSDAVKAITISRHGADFTPEQLAKVSEETSLYIGRVGKTLEGEDVRVLTKEGDEYFVQMADGTYAKKKLTKDIDPNEAGLVDDVLDESLDDIAAKNAVRPLSETRSLFKPNIGEISKMGKLAEYTQNAIDAIRATGRQVNKTGKDFSKGFVDSISKFTGLTSAAVRENIGTIARVIGLEDLDNMTLTAGKKRVLTPGMGKDTGIREFKITKRKKTTQKGVAVKIIDNDMSESFYVTNKKTELNPSAWVTDKNGRLIPNPDWDRLDMNPTLHRYQKTGEFQTWVKEDNGWYRPATKGEQGVLLNIRKPFRVNNISVDSRLADEDLLTNNIDGYYAVANGVPYYKPVSPFQAVEPEALGLKTIYKPTYVDFVEPKLRDAQGNVVENVPVQRTLDDVSEKEIDEVLDKLAKDEPLTDVQQNIARQLSDDAVDDVSTRTAAQELDRMTDEELAGLQRRLDDYRKTGVKPSDRDLELRDELVNRQAGGVDPTMSGLGGRVGGAFLGAAVGTAIADDESDMAAGGIGSVIGFLAGGKGRPGRATNRVVDYVTNVTKKSDAHAPAPFLEGMEVRNKAAEQARALGIVSDATPENVGFFNKTVAAIRNSVGKGESIFSNRLVQSSFSFLTQLSPKAREFRDIMAEAPRRAAKYRSIALNQYNLKHGSQAYESIKTVGGPEIKRMFDADPVLSREFAGMTDAEAMRQFDKFQTLAMETNGFSIKGIEASVSAQDWFARNPDMRRIYETMLQDQRFLDHMNFTKDMLQKVRKDMTEGMTADISRSFNRLSQEDQVLLSPWLFSNTRFSSTDYRKILRKENHTKVKAFDKIIRDTPLGSKIANMNDTLASFERFNEGYFTQMLDPQNFALLRKSVAEDFKRKNPGATAHEVDKAVLDWQIDEFMRLNEKASSTSAKTYLYHFNEDANDLIEKTYVTRDEAISELQDILNKRKLSAESSDRLVKDVDKLVSQDSSGLWRVDVGHPDYADVFSEFKKAQVERYIVSYMTGAAIKTSNYLDRNRKFHIPLEWRTTDINKWLYRYTQDVGQRNWLIKHGIVDHHDLRRDWLGEIEKEVAGKTDDMAKVRNQINRVRDIYNLQTGLVKSAMEGQTVQERLAMFDQRANMEKKIAILKNFSFAPFAPTISILDIASPAILGSMLSSFRSIKDAYKIVGNNENLNALMEFSAGAGGVSRKLSLIQPGMEDVEHILKENTIVNGVYDLSRKASDFGARFSLARGVEWGLNRAGITASLDNNGIAKLALGSFYDVNGISTTVNFVGALYELQGMLKRYADEGLTSELESKFANFGISKTRIAAFAQNSKSFDEFAENLRKGKPVSAQLADVHSSLYNDLTDVLSYVTDAYHGRNLMDRPELWTTPVGKLLSQFSTYPYNFASQVYKRRIQFPIESWMAKYNKDIPEDVTVPYILDAMARKDFKKLKGWNFTDEAINDLPVDALHTVYRSLGSLGLAVATFATRDAYLDAVNYPMLALAGAEEEEQFKRTKRNLTLNPYAPKSEQITWGEIDDIGDIGEAMRATGSWIARAGFLGKMGDVLTPFMARDGVVGALGPGAATINDMFKSVGRVYNGEFHEIPENTAKEVSRSLLKIIPAAGGYGVNRIAADALLNQKERTGFNDNDGILTYSQWRSSALEGRNLLDQ